MTPADQVVDAIRGLERSLARVKGATTTVSLNTTRIAVDRRKDLLRQLNEVERQLEEMLRNCRYQLQHLPAPEST